MKKKLLLIGLIAISFCSKAQNSTVEILLNLRDKISRIYKLKNLICSHKVPNNHQL